MVPDYTHVLLTSYAHLDGPLDEAHADAAGRRQRHPSFNIQRKARDGPQLIFIKKLAQEDSRFEQREALADARSSTATERQKALRRRRDAATDGEEPIRVK